MARRCIFCGRSDLTREHILAQWINGVLPGEGTHVAHVEVGEGTLSRANLTHRLDHVIKQVCRPCNQGWMADLEGNVQPLLTPMIQGNGTKLSSRQQAIVARWAVKTSTLMGLVDKPPRPFTSDHFRWLAGQQDPPPNAYVGIAAYGGSSWACRWDRHWFDASLLTIRHNDVRVDTSTLCIGHLVLQVIEWPIDYSGVSFGRPPGFDALTLQIWPRDRLQRH
jgi:hypothetical protein